MTWPSRRPLVAAGWNVVAVGTDAGWFSQAAAG